MEWLRNVNSSAMPIRDCAHEMTFYIVQRMSEYTQQAKIPDSDYCLAR